MENEKQSAASDEKTMKLMRWGINAGIAIAVTVGAYILLPYGVTFAEGLFQMTFAIAKTTLIAVPLLAGLSTLWASRGLFKRWQERFVGGLWEKWIYNDPIQYITEEVIGFRKEEKVVENARKQLQAVYDSLVSIGEGLVADARDHFTKAQAVEATDEMQASLLASFASNRLTSVENIKQSAADVADSIAVMAEIGHYLSLNIQKMEDDLEMMRLEMKVQMAQSSAADAVRSITQGSPDQRARLQFAQRAYRDRVTALSANYKTVMADVEPLLKSQRISEVIATNEGRQALQKLKENKDSLFGLKDFRSQLNDVAEQLGKNAPGYKTDLKTFSTKSATPLTKGRKINFGDLN